MKKIIIKTFILTLTLILCFGSLSAYAWEYKYVGSNPITEISVSLDGKLLDFDTKPQLINGRTMVPLTELAEILNAEILYSDNTDKGLSIALRCPVTRQEPNDWVKNIWIYFLGDAFSYDTIPHENYSGSFWDGVNKVLDSSPLNIDGQVFVPIRPICEALDYKIAWEHDIMYVHIASLHRGNYKLSYRKDTFPPFGTTTCEAICDNHGRRNITIAIEGDVTGDFFMETTNGEYLFFKNGADFTSEKTENGYKYSINYVPFPDTTYIHFYPTIDDDVTAIRLPVELKWNRP